MTKIDVGYIVRLFFITVLLLCIIQGLNIGFARRWQ